MENVVGSQSPGFFSVLKECPRKDPIENVVPFTVFPSFLPWMGGWSKM